MEVNVPVYRRRPLEDLKEAVTRVQWLLNAIQVSFNDAYKNQVEEKYKSYFTLDDTLVAHLGYITFRKYLPDKPHPFGMLLRVMALSQCRFIVKFELYVGKLNSLSNKVEDLVPRFCSAIPQVGIKKPTLFADNFYSTFGVCDKLSRST